MRPEARYHQYEDSPIELIELGHYRSEVGTRRLFADRVRHVVKLDLVKGKIAAKHEKEILGQVQVLDYFEVEWQ